MAAVAAHALSGLSPAMLRVVDSGIRMQGWHALALVAVGLWAERRAGPEDRLAHRLANWAGAAFALGTALFCGAVYAFGLAGVSLAAMAPTGGLLLIAGWLLLAASAALPARG